jgi:hypothetical protein
LVEVVDAVAVGLSTAERTYLEDMGAMVTTIRESLGRYEAFAEDPRFLDLDWLLKAAFEFMLWRSGYENALALEPPPAFAESHGRYLEALGLLAEISDDVAAAMDEGDLVAHMQIEAKITRAISVFDRATVLMEDAATERGG